MLGLLPFAALIIAYLLGSVCMAIPVCALCGLPDPRQQGSRNPGTTNVLRLGGRGPAALTLAGDTLKGLLPALVLRHFDASRLELTAVGLAAFLGHLYPIFFRFQGGKGVATAFGVIFALSPWLGLATGVTWLLVFALWRISSLAALSAFVLMPVYAHFLNAGSLPLLLLISLLLIWRHRSNIQALRRGQERHFQRHDGA